jgi:hypothetical protein
MDEEEIYHNKYNNFLNVKCIFLYDCKVQSNLSMRPPLLFSHMYKPVHAATSVMQSHILKGHLFLVLS